MKEREYGGSRLRKRDEGAAGNGHGMGNGSARFIRNFEVQ